MLPDGFEQPVCTLCRVAEVESFPSGTYHLNLLPPAQVSRCCRCGLLFLSPRPGLAQRLALMKGSVPASLSDYAASTANYAAVTYSRTALFAKRLETLARLYHVCQAGAVPHFLDIGASSGMLVKLARQKGWAADGLEPSSTGTRAALVQGLVFPQGVAEAIPFASQSFDIVHSHHVFEHLADPLQAIQEAYRLLRPGGLLYIEVPNQFDNIMFQRDIWLGRVPQRQRNLRSIHHLWFFSRRTLMRLFQEAGFRDVHVKDFYAWRPQGWRAPLQWLTRIMGAFFYGGHLLSAWGWK